MTTYLSNLINSKTLVVIAGPTASGKTGVSIELSKLLGIEVISADSRQIYKYLDIGTATPTEKELRAVTTHFINIIEPDKYYSAGIYGDEAEITANEILSMKKLPVVVGGSGLYIQALCEGFFQDDIEKTKRTEVQEKLNNILVNKGIEYLFNKLSIVDPVSAKKYNDKNPRRIIRALEYYEMTGIPFSEAHSKNKKDRDFNVLYFGLDMPREKLYERINKRAEIMWRSGIIEETKNVLNMGYSPELNSLNTVGYKEVIAYLNGEMDEKQALEKMKQNTRYYAKRQMTWFRRYDNMVWLSGTEEDIAKNIYNNLVELSK